MEELNNYNIVMIKKMIYDYMVSVYGSKNIRKVYLFGSYARGEENSNSDIDLLIDVDDNFTLFDQAKFKEGIEDTFHKNADVIIDEDLEGLFKENVYKERICIYERT